MQNKITNNKITCIGLNLNKIDFWEFSLTIRTVNTFFKKEEFLPAIKTTPTS